MNRPLVSFAWKTVLGPLLQKARPEVGIVDGLHYLWTIIARPKGTRRTALRDASLWVNLWVEIKTVAGTHRKYRFVADTLSAILFT